MTHDGLVEEMRVLRQDQEEQAEDIRLLRSGNRTLLDSTSKLAAELNRLAERVTDLEEGIAVDPESDPTPDGTLVVSIPHGSTDPRDVQINPPYEPEPEPDDDWRTLAGELNRLADRVSSNENALALHARKIEGIEQHAGGLQMRVDALEEVSSESQEDFEAGITKVFQERLKENTTLMELVPKVPDDGCHGIDEKPVLSDEMRAKKQAQVDELDRQALAMENTVNGLRETADGLSKQADKLREELAT